jgi:hypothetical protein
MLLAGALWVAACGGEPRGTRGMDGASAGGAPAGGGAGGATGGHGGAGGSTTTFDAGHGGAGGSDAGTAGGDGAGTDGGRDGEDGGVDGAAGPCSVALPVRCGDRLDHSTVVHGRADAWNTYSWTARYESGRETLYAFSTAGACAVVANLENLTTDLDLLLLAGCHPINSNLKASSTPIDSQTIETVAWNSSPGQTYYLVVDGYNKAEGSYTLEVDCTCN